MTKNENYCFLTKNGYYICEAENLTEALLLYNGWYGNLKITDDTFRKVAKDLTVEQKLYFYNSLINYDYDKIDRVLTNFITLIPSE